MVKAYGVPSCETALWMLINPKTGQNTYIYQLCVVSILMFNEE